jgi:general secretion pathway protein J
MGRTRKGLSRMADRYHQGRTALSRVARELQSAYLSRHLPLDQNAIVSKTAFVGEDSSPADRVDFTAFAHRRLARDAHESDQSEIGFFAARDPEESGKLDLVRRESKRIDLEPTRGGIIQVLAEDIESFTLQYLDPMTLEWVDTWDSTQPAAQLDRLPSQIWVTLVLKGGPGDRPIKFETKVPIAMQVPLAFAAQGMNAPGSLPGSSGGLNPGLNTGINPGGATGPRPTTPRPTLPTNPMTPKGR